jgi:hypothetical protein
MAETKTDKSTIKLNIGAAAKKTQPSAKPDKKGPDKSGYWWGTGRRKSSVARVRIKPGEGKMLVNSSKITSIVSRTEKQCCLR